MLRIREKNSYKYTIEKCSCLKNYKYIRYIISIIHIKYIYKFFSFFFCYTNLHRTWRRDLVQLLYRTISYKSFIIFFFFFSLVFFFFWFCGGEYLPRKLFIVDSLTVKAFPFSSFSAMRRFNSSSPGMQTTAIRLKSLKPFILRLWAEAYAFVYKNIDTGLMFGWFGCGCLLLLLIDWLLVGCLVETVVVLYCCLGCVVRWLVGTFIVVVG